MLKYKLHANPSIYGQDKYPFIVQQYEKTEQGLISLGSVFKGHLTKCREVLKQYG